MEEEKEKVKKEKEKDLEERRKRRKQKKEQNEDENKEITQQKGAQGGSETKLRKKIEEKKQKDKLEVPQLSTQNKTFNNLVKVESEMEIKEDLNNFSIPEFDIDKGSIPSSIKGKDINSELNIKNKEIITLIPDIKLQSHKIKAGLEINDAVPEIVGEKKVVRIPQIKADTADRVYPYESFLSEKPFLSPDLNEQEEEKTPSVKVKDSVTPIGEGGEGKEAELEELPDPFELFFKGEGSKKIEGDEPLVICLDDSKNDSFMGTLRTMCKRIFREKKGGNPQPLIIRDFEEFEEEQRWMEAEDKIFSLQLEKEEWDELDWEKIWSRIEQLFSQNFGYIILNYDYNINQVGVEHIVKIINLTPRDLDDNIQKKIAEICWGFLPIEPQSPQDTMFEEGRIYFEEYLKEIGKEERGIFADATNQSKSKESNLHLRLKWFIVKKLVERLREEGEDLKTPKQIEEIINTEEEIINTKITPDVRYRDQVFEVETLFAEDRQGRTPRNKLIYTFKKYEGTDISEINIILDNLTYLRHLKDIFHLKRNYQDWMEKTNKEVNFLTLDLRNEKFVNFNEFINELKKIDEIAF